MKDINAWAKDLKHNEKTANKYKGVKTVEDILRVAREDGYNFTEKELLDFNLDLVAGGVGDVSVDTNIKSDVNTGSNTNTSTATTTGKTINSELKQSGNNTGNNNSFNFSANNNNTQT